jgi:hypothetical protein
LSRRRPGKARQDRQQSRGPSFGGKLTTVLRRQAASNRARKKQQVKAEGRTKKKKYVIE